MIGKNEEVHKETQEILRKIIKKYEYDVVPERSQESVQTSILKFLGIPSLGDEPKSAKLNEQTTKPIAATNDLDNNQQIVDLGEEVQDPLVMVVNSEKNMKEVGGEKAKDAKMEEKEKDERNIEQVSMARDTTNFVKGKQIISDIDLIQGPININSLSLVQALKFSALAQAKTSEELLKTHTEDKDLISLAMSDLENFFP